MRQCHLQFGKGMGVHLLEYGASCQANVDDVVRCLRRLAGNLSSSGFPDSEVFATGHDHNYFMLPNSIASASGQIPSSKSPNSKQIPNPKSQLSKQLTKKTFFENGFRIEIGRVIFEGESEALYIRFDRNGEVCHVLNLLLAEIYDFFKCKISLSTECIIIRRDRFIVKKFVHQKILLATSPFTA